MAVDRTHPQGSAARRLLQQRDLPSVVEVMLHHAVEQDVDVVRLARHGPFEVLDTKLADRLQERRSNRPAGRADLPRSVLEPRP